MAVRSVRLRGPAEIIAAVAGLTKAQFDELECIAPAESSDPAEWLRCVNEWLDRNEVGYGAN